MAEPRTTYFCVEMDAHILMQTAIVQRATYGKLDPFNYQNDFY